MQASRYGERKAAHYQEDATFCLRTDIRRYISKRIYRCIQEDHRKALFSMAQR